MPCILHCNAKKISNTISSQVSGQAQLPGVFIYIVDHFGNYPLLGGQTCSISTHPNTQRPPPVRGELQSLRLVPGPTCLILPKVTGCLDPDGITNKSFCKKLFSWDTSLQWSPVNKREQCIHRSRFFSLITVFGLVNILLDHFYHCH